MTLVYFGTNNRGPGIVIADLDEATGTLTLRQEVDIPGRGWLDIDPTSRYLVAAIDGDALASFAIDKGTGALTPINTAPTGTGSVSHLTFDPQGHYIFGASYSHGAVSVVSIGEDGKLGGPTDVVEHDGPVPGPHPDQTQARAHMSPFDPSGRWVVVNDLGLDRTYVYHRDSDPSKLVANDPPYIQFPLGRGPRHISFHPNGKLAYIVNELSAELTALTFDPTKGTFTELQCESILPPGWQGKKWAAQVVVHPSGRWVYASNRGSETGVDDIAIFAIDQATGRISLTGHADTLGKTARNFNVDPSGKYLICVHQDSDNAVVFSIDQASGLLTPTGQQFTATGAVCTQFAPGLG